MSRVHRNRIGVYLLALLGLCVAAWADEPPPTAKSPAAAAPVEFPPGRVIFQQSETEKRIRAALAEPTDFNFIDTQLGDVATFISDKHNIPVILDAPTLTADGKGRETLINKTLREAPLGKALRLTLDEQGLTFAVVNDVLLITTKSRAETITPVRIYQVQDLVVRANDPTASNPNFESLIELITSAIEPDTWREAGGTQGEIKQYVGAGILALVVTQTEKVHDDIERLLTDLRAAHEKSVRDAQATQRLSPYAAHASIRSESSAGTNIGERQARPPAKTPEFTAVIDGNRRWACDLYARLAAGARKDRNVVFSPIGLSTAMATVYAGARGRTAEEIAAVLHFPDAAVLNRQMRPLNAWLNGDTATRGYALHSRTRLFFQHDERLLASYLGVLAGDYDALPVPVDYGAGKADALARIHAAIRDDSEGFLDPAGLTDGIDANTRLYAMNTIDFRGRWAEPFDPKQTLREAFHAPAGDRNVEMMHDVGRMNYKEIDGLQIVRKRYAGMPDADRPAFYVFLPAAEPGALAKCERRLTPENLTRWCENFDDELVELHLPKFTFDNLLELGPDLAGVGIKHAFDGSPGHCNADFSGINGEKTLYLQGVRQKAKIEVNEKETRAVAVTSIAGFGGALSPSQPEIPILVRCDRPFLFLILDEATGAILFLGRVTEPNNDPNAPLSPPISRAQAGDESMF